MADSKNVKDITLPVVRINAGETVGDAINKLEVAKAKYGIFGGGQDELLALFTVEQLRARDADEPINAYAQTVPRPVVVESHLTLDDCAQKHAIDFVLQPELPGIVVREGEAVNGILPRQMILSNAAHIVSKRSIDRLEGSPLDSLIFECLIDHERKIVDYYDPNNRPLCRNGHQMEPVEE